MLAMGRIEVNELETAMSQTTTPQVGDAAPAAKPLAISLAEYVRGLSPEDKQVVFLALLREALEFNGDSGLLPIEDEAGKPFGYYVPPKAAQTLSDQTWNEMPASVRDAMNRPVKNLDNCISADQMLDLLSREPGSPPR